jgi:hypothetical protein
VAARGTRVRLRRPGPDQSNLAERFSVVTGVGP